MDTKNHECKAFIQAFFQQIRQEGGSHTGPMEPIRLKLEEKLGYFISRILVGHLVRKTKKYQYIKADMADPVQHEALGMIFPAGKSKTARYRLMVTPEDEPGVIQHLASELREYDCYTGPFVAPSIIKTLLEAASVHGESFLGKSVPIPLAPYFLSPQRAEQLMKRYELKKVTPATTGETWPLVRQAIDQYHAALIDCIHDVRIIGQLPYMKFSGRVTAGSSQGSDKIILYSEDQQYVFHIGKVLIRKHRIQFVIGSRITEPFGKELLPKTGILQIMKTLSDEEVKAFLFMRNVIRRKLNRLGIHYEF